MELTWILLSLKKPNNTTQNPICAVKSIVKRCNDALDFYRFYPLNATFAEVNVSFYN